MGRSNRIIAPPVLIYAATTMAALLLHWYRPLILLPWDGTVVRVAGRAVCIAAGALALWAFVVMRRTRTTVNPYKVASRVVSHGPFGISRNPMYLSLLFLYPGLALFLNSSWMMLAGAAYFVVMRQGVIVIEERALLEKFGAEYEEYMSKVRRWL
jgi:protein-S-isoprenylcysteine O-methyltransferase Ste14